MNFLDGFSYGSLPHVVTSTIRSISRSYLIITWLLSHCIHLTNPNIWSGESHIFLWLIPWNYPILISSSFHRIQWCFFFRMITPSYSIHVPFVSIHISFNHHMEQCLSHKLPLELSHPSSEVGQSGAQQLSHLLPARRGAVIFVPSFVIFQGDESTIIDRDIVDIPSGKLT